MGGEGEVCGICRRAYSSTSQFLGRCRSCICCREVSEHEVGDREDSVWRKCGAFLSEDIELLNAYPNLKGIVGFGSLGPIGASQALNARNMKGKVQIVGTVIPSHADPYLKQGLMQWGYLWDPKDADLHRFILRKHCWTQRMLLQRPEFRKVLCQRSSMALRYPVLKGNSRRKHSQI